MASRSVGMAGADGEKRDGGDTRGVTGNHPLCEAVAEAMKPFAVDNPSVMGSPRNKDFTILVADRNPHVRDFLRREMMSEGFRVELGRNAEEVLNRVFRDESIDLIIMDPDLPDVPQEELLAKLLDRIPGIPIVVHAFSPQDIQISEESAQMTFVRKEGESIDTLKKVVRELLTKPDPRDGKQVHASIYADETSRQIP